MILPEPSKQRIHMVDAAAGITMILVVFGHNYFDDFRQDSIYAPLRIFIYQFHMSVFFFLSGFIIFYSFKPIKSIPEYWRYISRKGRKFIPIYFLLSIFYLLADLFLKNLSPDQIPDQVYKIFLSPVQSSAKFLWYIYVLMIFYLITPVLKSLPHKMMYLVVALAFFLTLIRFPYEFSANLAGKYFLFFILGGMMAERIDLLKTIVKKYGLISLCVFCLLFINAFVDITDVPYQLTSVIAIISILYLSSLYIVEKLSILKKIGIHSYYIYLLNSLVIGTFYLMYHKTPLHVYIHPRVYIVMLTILGTLLPLWFSMFDSRRNNTILN